MPIATSGSLCFIAAVNKRNMLDQARTDEKKTPSAIRTIGNISLGQVSVKGD